MFLTGEILQWLRERRNTQMKYAKKVIGKRLLSGMLSAVLTVTALPLASLTMPQKEVKAASVTLQNPRIVKDDSMKAGQKVTWDCIWFGSYPQREVVADAASYNAIQKDYYNPQTDIIEEAALFQKLETASGWNDNEIVLDGNKYRRMKQEDAIHSTSDSASGAYYRWKDSTSWHYFRYEPIKWRVLSTAGGQAFLLSDMALDDQMYNNNDASVTWETSNMRSWLNGYGAETNEPKIDYRSNSFLQDAFSSAGQQAICTTEVENADNLEYGTEGGNNTKDKIFLLSEQEVYGTKAGSYGFAEAYDTYDEARGRKSSTYAKAKGVWGYYGDGAGYDGNCWWWLRTPGDHADITMKVSNYGYVDRFGFNVIINDYGVCPALNLNLSSSDLWSYAGTVCSDGTVKEQAAPGGGGSGETPGGGSDSKTVPKIELDTSSLSEDTFQVGDEKQLPYSLYAESESKLKEMVDSLSWTDEGGKLAITDGLLVMPTAPEKLGDQTVWRASSRIMITAKQAGKTTLIGKTSDGTTVKQEIEITSGSEENDSSGIDYSTTLDKWLLDQGTSSAMNYLAKDKHFANSEAVATFDSDFGFKLTESWSNMLFRGNDGWREIFTKATSREQARDILIALLEKQSEKTQELEDVETAHKYADIYVKTLKQANWAYAIDYGLNSEEIQYLSEVCVPDKIAQFFIDGEYSSISLYLKIKCGLGEKSKVVKCIESFEKSAKLADSLAEKLEWLDTGTKILSMTEDTINALYNVERLWKTDEMYSEMLAYIRDNCPFLAVSQAADDLYGVIHGGYMGAFSYASESIKNTFGGMVTDKVLDTLIDAIPWGALVNTTYKFSVGIYNIIFKINDTQKQKDNMRCVAYIGHYIGAWMVQNRLNYLTGTTAEKNTYAKKTVYAYYMLLKTRMAGEESLQKMMNLAGTSWQRAYTVSKEISATLESNEKWLKNSGVLKNISTSVVACPVDVEIYDAAGKMVERVYDGKETEGYTGDIYYNVFYNPVADDYVKIIRLPADEGYSLKCEATDTGSVDYYFSAFDKDGNVVQKEIENIPVETGNSVQIPDTSGNRTECILKKGDDIEKEYIAQTVSEEYVAVTGIRTDITTLELKPGEKKRVNITILPENASAKAVTWTSSDSDVASVNADGVITGIKTGNVVITAKAVNEEVSVQFSVKVTEKAQTDESEISSQKPTLKPDTSSQKEQITSVKVGDIIKTGQAQYRIIATGAVKTVEYQKTLSKTQKNIKIPATVTINKEVYRVTSIAKNCFKGNKKLKTITISKNIKTIGANAFSGCKNLKTIKIASTSLTKKSVGKNVFKGIYKKAVIKVPRKKLKNYQKILKGKGQAKSVKIQ